MEFLNQERLRHEKLDYYLAQIAAMIVAVNSKEPGKVAIGDYLLKSEPPPQTVADSKAIWSMALGLPLPKGEQ